MLEPTIYELSSPGRTGIRFPDSDVPYTPLPANLIREELKFPSYLR
jgi:glycine dehydrogenase subunit 2